MNQEEQTKELIWIIEELKEEVEIKEELRKRAENELEKFEIQKEFDE